MSSQETIKRLRNKELRTTETDLSVLDSFKEVQKFEDDPTGGVLLMPPGWFSKVLGNNGNLCTVTKECMPSCN